MEPQDEAKSTDRPSSHSSQGNRKRRPSLFPLRSSAKRKSSLCEDNDLFNPHNSASRRNSSVHSAHQTEATACKDTKSELEFTFVTPSENSAYSSPKTPRSSIKDLEVDTPFVPFVHQSLSRTVWQSDEVIPEERDDFDKKESQSQFHIKPPSQQGDAVIESEKQEEQMQRPQTFRPANNRARNQHKAEQIGLAEQTSFQTCLAVSLSVPPAECPNPGLTEFPTETSNENQHAGCQFEQEPVVQEVETKITHEVYVSRAPLLHEQQMQTIHQNRRKNFSFSNSYEYYVLPAGRKIFTFSYLQCVSVRSVPKAHQQCSQQTLGRQLGIYSAGGERVDPASKQCSLCQTQNNLQVGNQMSQRVEPIKKHHSANQTSIHDRISMFAKIYEEKIGVPRAVASFEQQTEPREYYCCAQQTDKPNDKRFTIREQLNMSVSFNYGDNLGVHIVRFENYLKNLHEKRQSELSNQAKKSASKYTSTEPIMNEAAAAYMRSPSPSPSPSLSQRKKYIKNFGCQYDPKDIGMIKPSLKRVSIAETKDNIIFQLENSNNSTETFENDNTKPAKKGRKSKKQVLPQPKIEQAPTQEEEDTDHEVSKSKTKNNKGSSRSKNKKKK